MLINDLASTVTEDRRVLSASVVWEDQDFPPQELTFEIGGSENSDIAGGERAAPPLLPGGADTFLAACFPLAAIHGETRIKIAARPCPMLVEGLRTAFAWWSSWGGMPSRPPAIETAARDNYPDPGGPRYAVALLSGGVDSLHLLMRNRQLYGPNDPAYIREALFIHGYDIGKRARDPERDRYRAALKRLEPVAAETGLRLIPCRTNLRHLPSKPGFWANRHSGAALAAVGHAAIRGSGFMFIGGTYHVATQVPVGTHPAVDGLLSSQRVSVIHDGSRFSRLEKVCELARWPTALAALRVCPEGHGDDVNCGCCEKCLHTRLELLAAGVDETAALGPSLTPVELWDQAVPTPINHRAVRYVDLLAPLRERGFDALCRMLEGKIAAYQLELGEGRTCAAD